MPAATAAPDVLRVGTDELTVHVSCADTGGRLLAVEVRMPAGGGPPMLHRHAATEVYRVDAGTLTFYLREPDGSVARRTSGPGEVVHIEGGREHTIRNEGPGPASAYVVFADGAPAMEAFVREAARLSQQGAPAVADVLAAAERHGVEMTRPIPR